MRETFATREALVALAPIAVREGDPEGLRAYIERVTLCRNEFHALPAAPVGHRLREFRNGFVYDRVAQLIFPCAHGLHSRCAAGLACLRGLTFPLDIHAQANAVVNRRGQEADRFLAEGWGFVVNSPILSGVNLERPWPVRLGGAVHLTAQEKLWFRGFDLIRHD
jgi:hypothetical protein